MAVRYPDAAPDAPHELYDQETAEDRIARAEEVTAWIKNQLKEFEASTE